MREWKILEVGQQSSRVVDCLQDLLDKIRKRFAVQFSDGLESHKRDHENDLYYDGW